MKNLVRLLMILLVVVFSGSMAYAGTASPGPLPGEPPYGMAYQSDAAGTKLIGVMCIEYYNQHYVGGTLYGDARIVARLRKGSDIKVLYGEASHVNLDNISANQAAITAAMEPKVFEAFPELTGLDVTLKSVEEYGDSDDILREKKICYCTPILTNGTCTCNLGVNIELDTITYAVFDIQIAVK